MPHHTHWTGDQTQLFIKNSNDLFVLNLEKPCIMVFSPHCFHTVFTVKTGLHIGMSSFHTLQYFTLPHEFWRNPADSNWNVGIPFQQIPSSFHQIPRAIPTHSNPFHGPFQHIPVNCKCHPMSCDLVWAYFDKLILRIPYSIWVWLVKTKIYWKQLPKFTLLHWI